MTSNASVATTSFRSRFDRQLLDSTDFFSINIFSNRSISGKTGVSTTAYRFA